MGYPRILYDNRLADAVPVASSTAAGDFNALNLRDFKPFTWWKPAAMPATVTVDSGVAKAADYWLVWGHDLFTRGATIELRGSTNNFAGSDVLVDSVTPASDAPFARYFASASYRYWRLRVTGATAPALAVAAMGARLEVPSYLREGFDPRGRVPQGTLNRSVKGHPLSRMIEFEDWTETLNFELLTWAWIRATWEPAWAAWLRGNPFVFDWDAAGHPSEIRLVNATGGWKAPHRAGGYADLSLEVAGVI